MLGVLVFERLEGFGAAGDDDDVVGLGGAEEVFCYGEADSWEFVSGCSCLKIGVVSTSGGAGDDDGFGGHGYL